MGMSRSVLGANSSSSLTRRSASPCSWTYCSNASMLGRFGSISRDDVAAVLVGCLDEPRTVRATFDLLQGETPIAQALAEL